MAKAKVSRNLEALPRLKMILIGAPMNEVLTSITRLIEAHSTGMLCSIFLLGLDSLHMRYGVAASLPEAYRAAADGICSGPDVGSCGTAAYLRQPVFVSDIASDPRWVKFKDVALQSGLRAAWATPIMSLDGKVLETFGMYYREVRQPGPGRNSADRLRQPHRRNRHRARSVARCPDKGMRRVSTPPALLG